MKDDNNIKIFPSLLSAHAGKFQEEINSIEEVVDGIHFDVMDGQFVPNLTFGAPVLSYLSTKAPMGFDAHLMVQNPDILIDDFAQAGCQSLSVHAEVLPHIHKTLEYIKSSGMKAGIVLNPANSFEYVKEAIAVADYVLVMSVNPGFGGQKFIPEVLTKIETIRKSFPKKDIQIDGGINNETAILAKNAGANWFVSGSYLFSAPNRPHQVERLRDILQGVS